MQPLLLLLAALPTPAAPTPLATAPPALLQEDDVRAEYEKRREAAEGDVEKLWELVDWCEANSLKRERRSCLHAIVRLDDEQRKAHELLGHVYYDGQWFRSEKKLEQYKEEEAERIAKEKGYVRYEDRWVDPDHIPYLEEGLVQDPDGNWVEPIVLQRIEEGWRLHDLTWIPPDEFKYEDQGLFKCGDEWLTLEEANAYHAELGKWWRLPGSYFHVYTTLPREVAIKARDHADRTFGELKRIFGQAPTEPLIVVVLRSGEQYNAFAGGKEGVWTDADIAGFSGVHGAYFADGLINYDERKWNGAGAAYWDFATEAGNSYGPTFVRHAAGQSFAEWVDPSPEAVADFEGSNQSEFDAEAFYEEKQLPQWFRYGAAVYVERYATDPWVGADGDPHWARKWSIANIANKGGLDPLSKIFDFEIGVDNPESGKLINEAGLLVAFMLDGECAPVKEAHGAVKAALKSGEGVEGAFEQLEEALQENADQLRKFANL